MNKKTLLGSEQMELKNDIDRRLGQLSSLLFCSYGFGQEWIDEMGSDHRDRLLWLASDLAIEVEEKFDRLCEISRIDLGKESTSA